MRAPPLTHLLLINLPQLIDIRHLPRDRPFDHLDSSSHTRPLGQSIRCSQSLDLDHADSGIILASVVCAVAQVTKPGFERGRVVFLDGGAVINDGCRAAHTRPAAGGVQEGDINMRVGLEVGCLARLGVCVEEKVDAAGFLVRSVACLGELSDARREGHT